MQTRCNWSPNRNGLLFTFLRPRPSRSFSVDSSLLFSAFSPLFFSLLFHRAALVESLRYIFRFNSPSILMASLNLRGSTFSAPAGFYGPFVFIHFADLSHFGRFWLSSFSLPSRFHILPKRSSLCTFFFISFVGEYSGSVSITAWIRFIISVTGKVNYLNLSYFIYLKRIEIENKRWIHTS